MKRSVLDKLISFTGLVIALVLLAAAGGLFYAHSFIHTQVYNQLAAEKISFPAAGSQGLNALPAADRDQVGKYAGQQLLTGAQAKVFADNYIAVHLKEIGGGQTYAQLSAASMADPSNAKLAGQVQTIFRGETLRGMLLNAYAFDTMAVIAGFAGYVALAGSVLLFLLAGLGFTHSERAKKRGH